MGTDLPPFPEFLNEQVKFIKWTATEIMCFILPLATVWIFYSNILGFGVYLVAPVSGLISVFVYRSLAMGPNGDLLPGLFYWLVPSKGFYNSLPPSYIREFFS
jgi:hypothetical protein